MLTALLNFFAREHVFFSHFPVALITVGATLRIIWAVRPSEAAWQSSHATLAIGAASAFFTIFSGLARVNFQFALPEPLLKHGYTALMLGTWCGVHLIFVLLKPAWMNSRVKAAVWALLGAALALATGYLGSLVARWLVD